MKAKTKEKFAYLHSLDTIESVKEQIEQWFPNEFKKANGWYKVKQSYGYWFGFYENSLLKYVITYDGFSKIDINSYYENEKKATDKEVEEALTKEAVKRGFKNGNYKCLRGKTFSNCNRIYYNKEMNELRITNGLNYNVIFKKGIWAEIISEPTLEQRVERIEKQLNIE